MKKSKCLILCVMLSATVLFATGCGNNDANDNTNGTQAPYHDETNQKVNDTSNNGATEDDLEQSGDSLKDAGKNLMDSVEETGDAIRDGIDNLGNDADDTNNMDNTNGTNRTESEDVENNRNNGTIEENGINDMDVAP